jgi:cell division protein FtsB
MVRRPDTERVAVELPETPGRPTAWLRNFRLSGFALSMLLLIVAALVVLAPRLKTLVEQQQQIAQLQQSVADARKSVDQLGDQVARWSDPAYIEAQARDRLYYVYPGDISYLVIGDDGETVASNQVPVSDSIQSTRIDWTHALLSSIYQAGLTEATPEQLDSPTQGGSAENGAVG